MGDTITKGLSGLGYLGSGYHDAEGTIKGINAQNKLAADTAATGNLIDAYAPMAQKLGVNRNTLATMPSDSIPAFIGALQRDQAAGVSQPIAQAGEARTAEKAGEKKARDAAREAAINAKLPNLSPGDRFIVESKVKGGDYAGAEDVYLKSLDARLAEDINSGANPGSASDVETYFRSTVKDKKQAKAKANAFLKNRTELTQPGIGGQFMDLLGGGSRKVKGAPAAPTAPAAAPTPADIAAEIARRGLKKTR